MPLNQNKKRMNFDTIFSYAIYIIILTCFVATGFIIIENVFDGYILIKRSHVSLYGAFIPLLVGLILSAYITYLKILSTPPLKK